MEMKIRIKINKNSSGEAKISDEEIERYNKKQKELEEAFSDEKYYPYLEKIKTKTLKPKNGE